MFRFFECHQIDPYSCVISQEPSKEVRFIKFGNILQTEFFLIVF